MNALCANADIADKPASVARVLAQIGAADAVVFGCPEYNYSLAPALKNIIDWASREPGNADFPALHRLRAGAA